MKNFLFLLLAICTVSACTTPEEDAQIKLFWAEQIMQLMPQPTAPAMLPPTPFPVLPDEESLQETPTPVENPLPASKEDPSQTSSADSQIAQESATADSPNTDTPPLQTATAANPQKSPQEPKQFLEITLEDSRVNNFKSNAPFKERQAMQRALERVKQTNQQAVQDIGYMFDTDTQAQAFAIVSKSEKILFRTANVSDNYESYLRAQQKILQEQEQLLNQLMRANAYKIRRIRG